MKVADIHMDTTYLVCFVEYCKPVPSQPNSSKPRGTLALHICNGHKRLDILRRLLALEACQCSLVPTYIATGLSYCNVSCHRGLSSEGAIERLIALRMRNLKYIASLASLA